MVDPVLIRLARFAGGVVLLQGRLGHQILGQLLIAGATDLEVAGANLIVTATAGQRSAFGQVALRTAVPALAIHALFRKTQARLEAQAEVLEKQTQALQDQKDAHSQSLRHLDSRIRQFEKKTRDEGARLAADRLEFHGLEDRRQRIEAHESKLAARQAELAKREQAHAQQIAVRRSDLEREMEALRQENERLRRALEEAGPPRQPAAAGSKKWTKPPSK